MSGDQPNIDYNDPLIIDMFRLRRLRDQFALDLAHHDRGDITRRNDIDMPDPRLFNCCEAFQVRYSSAASALAQLVERIAVQIEIREKITGVALGQLPPALPSAAEDNRDDRIDDLGDSGHPVDSWRIVHIPFLWGDDARIPRQPGGPGLRQPSKRTKS